MRLVLRYVALSVAGTLAVGMLVGQYYEPQVYSVANSASYAVSGQNGYGMAQGSLFVVFGQYLGPAQVQQIQSFPLPTSLAGSSVQVSIFERANGQLAGGSLGQMRSSSARPLAQLQKLATMPVANCLRVIVWYRLS